MHVSPLRKILKKKKETSSALWRANFQVCERSSGIIWNSDRDEIPASSWALSGTLVCEMKSNTWSRVMSDRIGAEEARERKDARKTDPRSGRERGERIAELYGESVCEGGWRIREWEDRGG